MERSTDTHCWANTSRVERAAGRLQCRVCWQLAGLVMLRVIPAKADGYQQAAVLWRRPTPEKQMPQSGPTQAPWMAGSSCMSVTWPVAAAACGMVTLAVVWAPHWRHCSGLVTWSPKRQGCVCPMALTCDVHRLCRGSGAEHVVGVVATVGSRCSRGQKVCLCFEAAAPLANGDIGAVVCVVLYLSFAYCCPLSPFCSPRSDVWCDRVRGV
jgi:hypothetical protein